MNYDNPELQHRLAAEYVLGTLHGAARERFQRLMAEKPGLRQTVQAWELRLNPWGSLARPEKVPAHVWSNVRARLGFPLEEKKSWRVRLWQGWAIGSTVLAVALAAVLVLRPAPLTPSAPLPAALAVLNAGNGAPAWLVQTDPQRSRLWLTRLDGAPVPAGHDLELWSIPGDGKPRSLGVIRVRSGTGTVALDPTRQRLTREATVLAISLEPTNGSPTGQPTGPVLYTGKPAAI